MKAALPLLALALFACGAPPSGLDTASVRSAEIGGIEDDPIVLVDGRWEGAPYVEGGAARPSLGLVEELIVHGEFIEPGQENCAVLVWHATGGSGNRLWLVILESAPGRPRSVVTELVGDRVQVVRFSYFDDLIRLDLIAHGPQDAACCPGQYERRAYRMVGDQLVATTEVIGRVSTKCFGGVVWRLDRMRRGHEKEAEAEVTIEFDRLGHVVGESGCNSFAGEAIDSDGRDVRIEVGPTSARRCAAGNVAFEQEFLRRLAAVERFSFVNGRLLLQYALEDETDAMTFVADGP